MITDNIFRRKFTAFELYQWVNEHFPYSFSLDICEVKGRGANPDYNKVIWMLHRAYAADCGYNPKKHYRKHPREYRLYDRLEFQVYSGEENTYIYFIIESDEDIHVATFGYKRGDVERDYAQEFVSVLCQTVHDFKGTMVYGRDYSANKNIWSNPEYLRIAEEIKAKSKSKPVKA